MMRTRRSKIVCASAAAVAAMAFAAAAETTVSGNQGPSSSATPYLVPVGAGVRTVAILTTGDGVNPKLDNVTPYRMVGIPDGLGALDAGDGTMLVTMNHEINAGAAVARTHGSAGAFVSAWRINKTTLQVVSGADLVRTVETWNSATQAFVQGTTTFDRFCSADLPAVSAFYDAATGLGTTERFHMNGEETTGGRAFAHQVTGPNAGVTTELPRFGRQAWENVVACPYPQAKTIVAATDDTTPGQVFLYVGTKLATGSDVQKAGLLNGTLYGVVANGVAAEDRTAGIGVAKGVGAGFTLAALTDQSAGGANTEVAATSAGVTKFLRPEDGAWDPAHPADFYFVTTDQFDQVKDGVGATVGRTRLWRLHFTDITTPAIGGTITMLLDGTEAGQMYDNICLDRTGHVLLQEDVGGNAHNGKVWQFDIASGALTLLAKHDTARFGDIGVAATAPFNNDEEATGIIDASDLLGPGWFLLADQAHYGISGELFQGGQLLALYNPDSVAAPAITAAATASPSPALVGQAVAFSVAASEPGAGALTYSWSFGDGGSASTKDATHSYAVSGTYTATVTATHTASGKTATSSVQVSVLRPFACFDVAVQLVFGSSSHRDDDDHHGWRHGWDDCWDDDKDEVAFSAEVPIASGFSVGGKVVSIDVGGIQRTYVLSNNGNGASTTGDRCRLEYRRQGNSVPAQRARFTAYVKASDLKTPLADEGLTSRNTSNEPVSVVARLTFDGRTESQTLELIYNAQAGKKGYAE